MKSYLIKNLTELKQFAQSLVAELKPGEVYGVSGELGAGKTTLVQMIGALLGVEGPMTSPTFVLRKEYVCHPLSLSPRTRSGVHDIRGSTLLHYLKKSGAGRLGGRDDNAINDNAIISKLIHIDAYRLEGGSAEDLGPLSEPGAVTFIEWPERLSHLPEGTKFIKISIEKEEARKIIIT
ncbi:MAG: tRNA (adenosine(37)-N6)-threonylcarbamoyltransferase complex ATPase subunit type 1 TsaE [bacterium]